MSIFPLYYTVILQHFLIKFLDTEEPFKKTYVADDSIVIGH